MPVLIHLIISSIHQYSLPMPSLFIPFPKAAYLANLNLVASSLPKPSLGATFLLLYEFVKSCNNVLIFLGSPCCTNWPMFRCSLSDSCGLTEPAGSMLMVAASHCAACGGITWNSPSKTPDASGRQSRGNVYIIPVMMRCVRTSPCSTRICLTAACTSGGLPCELPFCWSSEEEGLCSVPYAMKSRRKCNVDMSGSAFCRVKEELAAERIGFMSSHERVLRG